MGFKEKILLDIPIKLTGHAWLPAEIKYRKSYELNSLALISAEKALAQEIGWEKALERVRGSWRNLAREGVKEIIKEFNLKGTGADTIMKVFSIIALLLGFEHKITKMSKNEAIGIIHKCSHWNAMLRLNITDVWDCKAIHMDFVNAAIEEINPEMEARLEQAIPDGDKICKMVITKKTDKKVKTES